MTYKTLTYSSGVEGWPSFYSYVPEKMIGMNNFFYSFKGGNLYRHNSDNVNRNNFYEDAGAPKSTITGVVNDEVYTVKNFKTISLGSSQPWSCDIVTDLNTGFINADWFEEKEGDWFAYIRRNNDLEDLDMRSANGIGNISSIDSTNPATVKLIYDFSLGSILNVGDLLYRNNGGVLEFVGNIVVRGDQDIVVDTTLGMIPTVGDFTIFIKNNIAESNGARGYYMQFHLENKSTEFVELFSIGTNLFKSYP